MLSERTVEKLHNEAQSLGLERWDTRMAFARLVEALALENAAAACGRQGPSGGGNIVPPDGQDLLDRLRGLARKARKAAKEQR